ncbi:protein arginine N-methyltransferase 3-like [Limulus polyphemus]|uniref:type I protein arginine methyltransferase n=1 Tax=Limulus polyphemus TaxID=6850 RepID=A0ABM1SMU5_LIMPO|nr:protein arginine N-methyltransferase 3-like [Limulus polyphemus]XP_013777444.1 protein arginine N-methyltransferase 3-like [Limulus polyphemus]XP_022244951.1 protein arginine N-methyltransferase 3-like [Limulus polyphemus]
MEGDRKSDSDSSDWEDAEEMEKDIPVTPAMCLFCEVTFPHTEEVFEHIKTDHSFDIIKFGVRFHLDAVLWIKFVNFMRKQKLSISDLQEISPNVIPWEEESYMTPSCPDDSLLIFDFEDFISNYKCNTTEPLDGKFVSLPKKKYLELLQRLSLAESKLEDLQKDVEKMRLSVRNSFLQSHATTSPSDVWEKSVSLLKEEEDCSYFDSYSHFSIHHEMLQDKARTEAYRNAIFNNRDLFCNKIVLDVGCGTGILCMFAASAGAKEVVGIDQSEVVYHAVDIIRENNLQNQVILKKGRLEDVELPIEKVDIVISEWMGYFLFFEGMIDTVLYARDKYLIKGGTLLPNRCTISLIALSDEDLYQRYVRFWTDVYDFKMSCMKKEVIKEATIESVRKEKVCSEPAVVKELNLMSCSPEDCEFSSEFQLKINQNGGITAVAGYFDCFFDLEHSVELSTSPWVPLTHWKQTVFLLSDPIPVTQGDTVNGRIFCRRSRKERRSLLVTITLEDSSQSYFLS